MRAFEPTEAWLREAASEADAAGGKWSVGLDATMLRQLADRLGDEVLLTLNEFLHQHGRDGSAALRAKDRLYELTGVQKP